ncbi:MAG TPA: sugar MFS transporter [Candidatus Acidoferrales bacterium]|nr:sugar MFS transporter [Candidatus Acidoferrales bacterium]
MVTIRTNETRPPAFETPAQTNRAAMAMVTTLFFMWGFLTVLNDILIPHLKAIFDLNYAEVMTVQFAFFASYFVFAFPSGKLIDWVGYKRAMVAGLFTMGVGALLFIPAATAALFPLFLGALIVLAAGMTILQVSANPYVAVLGPEKTASSRLNLAQAFNSLGTAIGPKIGGVLILGSAPLAATVIAKMSDVQRHAYRVEQASTVKMPYLVFAGVLIALGIAMAVFKLPDVPAAHKTDSAGGHGSVWRYRHLVLGAIGIFVYVGAEVAIGSFLVNYLSQSYIGNLSLVSAAGYVSFYWGGAMVGRFIGSGLLQKVKTGTLLGINAIMACLLVCITMLTFGHIAMWSIILVGLFNSIMFPSIFTMSIEGLGPLTGDGSGILVAAIVGGAIIPEIQGVIADHIGIHHAFFLPALCYIYIAYFAFRGSHHDSPPA